MINAFTGASEALSSSFKTTFFHGLPEKFFHSALVWYFNHNEQRPRSGERTEFPSWSWAGSLGTRYYWFERIDLSGVYLSKPQGMGVTRGPADRDLQYGISELHIVNSENDLVPVGSDNIIKTESLKASQDKPLAELLKQRTKQLDESRVTLAKNHPHSLVFATLVADFLLEYEDPPPTKSQKDESRKGGSTIKFNASNDTSIPTLLLSNKLGKRGHRDRVWQEPVTELDHPEDSDDAVSEGPTRAQVVAITVCKSPINQRFHQDTSSFSGSRTDFRINVLILRRNDDGTSQRIGIGHVRIDDWVKARPSWGTVVVV